jgi:UDPglucose 6-dehydrogenase
MVKYASNAFLATRLSFINEIASICDQMGADVKEVAEGMGYDRRIGHAFLNAGLGWGGSCFPKDVQALAYMASTHGTHPQLLRAVIDINRYQRRRVVRQLRDWLGGLDERVVGLLGLSFKPNTDDMRSAPSIELTHLLRNEGAIVKGYDPAAGENAGRLLPELDLCDDAYQAAEGADALVLTTEWNEFKQLDKARLLSRMRQPYLIDGRNVYDAEEMARAGFVYWGMGRGKPIVG